MRHRMSPSHERGTPTFTQPGHLATSVRIAVGVLLVLALALTVPFDPEWWKVLLLGIVQGFTEFLPISSTGHLLIIGDAVHFQGHMGGTFEIFIQVGTVVSVVAFYFSDLLRQGQACLGMTAAAEAHGARRLWSGVLIAFLPAACLGALFRTQIKTLLFESPIIISSTLIIGGSIFLVLEWVPRRAAHTTQLEQITWKQALIMGVAQVVALVPGMSRSGSTIMGGLLAGLDRKTATAFSFYLSLPTLGAATLLDGGAALWHGLITISDMGRLLLGAVVSMMVGWWSIGWLLRYISRNSFVSFGIYRIVVGLLLLGLIMAGRFPGSA